VLALATFRRNLKSFVSLAKDNGIRVLFGNQALQPKEEMFVRHVSKKPFNSEMFYPLHSEFLSHHRAYNEAIRQVAGETGELFVDNDTRLGGDARYFIDHVHYTPEGVRVLARNYAEHILRAALIR
jgi:lysophospholipase L1-like esterase